MMPRSAVKTWSTPVSGGAAVLVPCTICGGRNFTPHLSCEGFSYVRCIQCGLVQMNPQPMAENVALRYRNHFAEDYLQYEITQEEAFLDLQEKALADAAFPGLEREILGRGKTTADGNVDESGANGGHGDEDDAGKKRAAILDIGCATGALLESLQSRGWRVTGVEICGPSAEYARSRRGIDVRELPLEENHFPGEGFEVILASHLIEHLNDPASFIREVRRLLRPGGRVFITTPNIDSFQGRFFKGRWRSAIFDHLYLFSKKTLSGLLEQEGFTIERSATWGGLAAGIGPAWLKRTLDRGAKRFGFGDVMIIRARK